jgi:hypothetical protein
MYGNDVSTRIPPLCIVWTRVRLALEVGRKTTTDKETPSLLLRMGNVQRLLRPRDRQGLKSKVPTGAPTSVLDSLRHPPGGPPIFRYGLVSRPLRTCIHIVYLKGHRGTGRNLGRNQP